MRRTAIPTIVALLVIGCSTAPPLATLSHDTTGAVSFQSLTFRGENLDPVMPPLLEGKPVVINGTLAFPAGVGPFPAVIITHGCSGISATQTGWAATLNKAGIATFLIDSFGGRNIQETCTGRYAANIAGLLTDVYRALDLLATHPRIDASRIALMGMSFGGRTAVWASLTRFQERYGSGRHHFAAYLAFYPASCYITLADETRVSSRPIRIFHGSADDWVPIAPCRQYVERMRRGGADVTLFEYPGAHHSFDNTTLPASRYWADGVTSRNCVFAERNGRIVDTATGKTGGIDSPCITRGTHFGHNADAYRKAVEDVHVVLRQALRMP
jgi:dienelactone hydrolase